MPAAQQQIPSPPRHVSAAPRLQTKDEMLIMATNRFCDMDTHDRLSTNQYREAFNLLIADASRSTRHLIARNLAHTPFTPRSIALYLAMEPLMISEPILKHSLVLGQLDLLQLLQKLDGDTDVVAMIASRPDIGPSVVRRLEEIDVEPVRQALDDNEALVKRGNERSAKALFAKIDIHNEALDAAEKAAAARAEIKQAAAAPQAERTAEEALMTAAGRGARLDSSQYDPVPSGPFDFAYSLEKLVRVRSHQGMAVLMQKQFGFTLETAHQVLGDKSGDTLAVLLSAADVSAAQANRIQLLTHPAIGLSTQNAMRAVRFYAQLNGQSSRAAVDQWPRVEKPAMPHQEQYQDGAPKRPANFARRVSSSETKTARPAQPEAEQFRSAG